MSKKCTPLWRDAPKCTKHTSSGPFLEVEMSKKCTPLWREADFEVKMYKTHQLRTTFGSWDVEKVHAVVASTFWSQKCKKPTGTEYFWTFRCAFTWQAQGIVHLKVRKTWGFCSISKSDGRRGTFEEDLQRCMSRGRRSKKVMFIRDVRRSGRWFPERGCILEHQIFRFAEMILRDGRSSSYDLASLFRGRRSTFDRWTGKIAKRIGTKLLALPFSKEVSQNCFVFDVVKLKNWRSLAEVLRLWRCQLWKMRKSRRIASFLMWSTWKNEEVS